MSDEPQKVVELPVRAPAGIYEHWCEHPGCGKWGGFGFQRLKGSEPIWFCFEHRDEGERYL